MTLYHIEPDQQTLHGAFSRDIDPVLTIDSGDTVRFRTLDSDWNLAPGNPPAMMSDPPSLHLGPRDRKMDIPYVVRWLFGAPNQA